MYRVCLMSGKFLAKEIEDIGEDEAEDIQCLVEDGTFVIIVDCLEELEELGDYKVEVV